MFALIATRKKFAKDATVQKNEKRRGKMLKIKGGSILPDWVFGLLAIFLVSFLGYNFFMILVSVAEAFKCVE